LPDAEVGVFSAV
jgi:hypothetical protein